MDKEIKGDLDVIDLSDYLDARMKYRIPTGIIAIDRIIGGGVPSGKLTEINGGWSAGKTRLLLHILSQVLEKNGIVMLLDFERALEKGLAEITNFDYKNDRVFYVNVDKVKHLENVFDVTLNQFISLVKSEYQKVPVAFAIDSTAAMISKEYWDKELGDNMTAARKAKSLGEALNKWMPRIHASNIAFIMINQLRDRFDVMFGDKTDTPGGKAVKFWASLRLKMNLIGKIKDDATKEQKASNVQIVCQKSKICRPFGMVEFEMPAYESISPYAGLLDYMLRHDEVVKVGQQSYRFQGQADSEKWTKKTFEKAYKESSFSERNVKKEDKE